MNTIRIESEKRGTRPVYVDLDEFKGNMTQAVLERVIEAIESLELPDPIEGTWSYKRPLRKKRVEASGALVNSLVGIASIGYMPTAENKGYLSISIEVAYDVPDRPQVRIDTQLSPGSFLLTAKVEDVAVAPSEMLHAQETGTPISVKRFKEYEVVGMTERVYWGVPTGYIIVCTAKEHDMLFG